MKHVNLFHCPFHGIIQLEDWRFDVGNVQNLATSQTHNVVWELVSDLECNVLKGAECFGISDEVAEKIRWQFQGPVVDHEFCLPWSQV